MNHSWSLLSSPCRLSFFSLLFIYFIILHFFSHYLSFSLLVTLLFISLASTTQILLFFSFLLSLFISHFLLICPLRFISSSFFWDWIITSTYLGTFQKVQYRLIFYCLWFCILIYSHMIAYHFLNSRDISKNWGKCLDRSLWHTICQQKHYRLHPHVHR